MTQCSAHLVLLALLSPVAGACARDRAGAGRRRAGAARRRGRARDPHAHQRRAGTAIGSTRAMPACRWTSSGSCRTGFARRAAALSGAEPAHRRRPDELCLRARLCGARAAEGARRTRSGIVPIRADAHWLACTDKICVPEQGELSLDLAGRQPARRSRAQFDEWRQALAAAARDASAISRSAGDKLRVAIPLPAERRGRQALLCSRSPTGRSIMRRSRTSAAPATTLIAELERKARRPRTFAGVLALGDGRGLEFDAVPGTVPAAARRSAARRASAVLWAVLGAIARRASCST